MQRTDRIKEKLMVYKKTLWKDQNVERPKTYEMTQNEDGSYALIDSFGEVIELEIGRAHV